MRNRQARLLCRGILMLFIVGAGVSGCSPAMRKKFIRERKGEAGQDLSAPVFDPVVYANRLETARARYDYFYALLKVWQKDALMLLDDGASDRQMRYALGQMKAQLQELARILDGSSRKTAQEGMQSVDDILAQYERAPALRNIGIIRQNIEQIERTVIKPLSLDVIRGDLKDYHG